MIYVSHKNNAGIHSFFIWDDSGWIYTIRPTSDFKAGKYQAQQIALSRQGKLKVEQSIVKEIVC